MSPLFYFLAAMTLGGAVASMSLRNPVHCALCLVVTFAGLAGIYLGLGAQFLGLAQVLVYVGAVAILLVFVVLLTRSGGAESRLRAPGWPSGLLLGGLFAGLLIVAVVSAPQLSPREIPPDLPSVAEIGHSLMTDFVMPLQLVGVLLTAAMIGAAIVALQERKGAHPPGPSSTR